MSRLLVLICTYSALLNDLAYGGPILIDRPTFIDSDSNSLGLQSKASKSTNWEYEDRNGWNEMYNNCNGIHQSPINIDPDKVTYKQYPELVFGNYKRMWSMSLTNDGRTVIVDLPANTSASDDIPYIAGGGLENRFNFAQLHFHWGGDVGRGSEHLIKAKRYSGELHMIHYNSKYASFDEAFTFKDGLAVLGILLERDWMENNVLNAFVSQFGEIQQSGQKANLRNPISLDELLPANLQSFYRYSGSLTTPGCQEIVSWTVFETPLVVSENHLEKFRELFDTKGHRLKDNYRPIQAANDRVITYSTDKDQIQFMEQQQNPASTSSNQESPSHVVTSDLQVILFPPTS